MKEDKPKTKITSDSLNDCWKKRNDVKLIGFSDLDLIRAIVCACNGLKEPLPEEEKEK